MLFTSAFPKRTEQAVSFVRYARGLEYRQLAPTMQIPVAHGGGDYFRTEVVEDSTYRHRVRLIGELDLASANVATGCLVKKAGSVVVADLSDLSFIDAAGITVLLDARQSIEADGHELELHGAQPQVRWVFEIVGLTFLLQD